MAVSDALEVACRGHFGRELRIEGLQRLTGGASQETWAFDVVFETGERQSLILRKDRLGSEYGLNRRGEFELLRAAQPAGVSVPAALFFLADAGGGAGYAMPRIEGETIPQRILRDPSLESTLAGLAARAGEELAKIHAIDLADVPFLPRPALGTTAAAHQMARLREVYDGFGEPHPALELGFRWLAQHEPPCARLSVVHGDFRHGNFILGSDGLRAVLDWELAHVGDPMEDLGWLCVRSWRFGRDRLPVGGFGRREVLFEAYERASGVTVDPTVVHYWEAFGNLQWAIICMMQAAAHYRGVQDSVELAAIGRRTCEAEWDLLELIG